MKFLFIGDIVGKIGFELVKSKINEIIKNHDINFVIANGENIANQNGITPDEAEDLFYSGVDVITLGNHAFRQRAIHSFLDDTKYIIRPANFSPLTPGNGYTICPTPTGDVLVINLAGQIGFNNPPDNPFLMIDQILKKVTAKYIIIDFHAEATSEKKAFGYYVDGRVTAVIGTHTHVQTADEQILPEKTFYITDVGMTGSQDSVLGVKSQAAIKRFITGLTLNRELAEGNLRINAVVFDTEKKNIIRIN